MTPKTELPSLTPEQLETLAQYALLNVGLTEVKSRLKDVLEFGFDPERRWVNTYFRVPEPGILITREHIANALTKKRNGAITERDLTNWASMLLMNGAYEFDSKDEELITEWLNDISYDLDPT
jgi:hypothetical protein